MVEQATHIRAYQVGAQRPRRVDISEDRTHVGHSRISEALVRPRLGKVDRLAVHHKVHLAECYQIEASRGHDDVGFKSLARCKRDASLSKICNGVGDHRGFARSN